VSGRVVIPSYLVAQAAVVNWALEAAGRPGRDGRPGHEDRPGGDVPDKHAAEVLQLRWMVHRDLGLQRNLFRVWRRPTVNAPKAQPIPGARLVEQSGERWLDWGDEPYAIVEIAINAASNVSATPTAEPGGGGVVYPPVTVKSSGQTQKLRLTGGTIRCVKLTGNFAIATYLDQDNHAQPDIKGVTSEEFANLADWQLVEVVGLPITLPTPGLPSGQEDWDKLPYDTGKQGLVDAQGKPTQSPRDAALRRLDVGAPKLGWYATTDLGGPVAAWAPPKSPAQFVDDDLAVVIVAELRAMLYWMHVKPMHAHEAIPLCHLTYKAAREMSDSDGITPQTGPPSAHFSPLAVTLLAAASDPFSALGLGFGAAYGVPLTMGNDWMVTLDASIQPGADARLACGNPFFQAPTPQSIDVSLGAFVIAPPMLSQPLAAPAQLVVERRHVNRPTAVDLPWSESVDVRWQWPLPGFGLPRADGCAVLRRGAQEPTARPLLQERRSGGWMPLVSTTVDEGAGKRREQLTDTIGHPLLGSTANTYSVAGQDLFGRWSPWTSTAPHQTLPDPVQRPQIVDASLSAVDDGSGLAAGTLVVDVTWDWADRTLQQLELQARVFAPPAPPAKLPENLSQPGGVLKEVGVPVSPAAVLVFSGAAAFGQPAGCTAAYLDVNGEAFSQTPPDPPEPPVRRYRITIPGFTLAFGAGKTAAVAVWARAIEHVRPALTSGWTRQVNVETRRPFKPTLTFAAPDQVQWASLPDVDGVSRATISWPDPSIDDDDRFLIYEANETRLRSLLNGSTDPQTNPQTYAQRLADLRSLDLQAVRHAFTRVHDKPVAGTSLEVTLPRGSALIHCFVVVRLGENNVASDWPSDAKDMIPVAVPRRAVPVEPRLELASDPASSAARCEVGVRPQVAVERVELYRTRRERNAASLDRMGPPVSVVTSPEDKSDPPGWTLAYEALKDEQKGNLIAATHLDPLTPSWDTWWYRAAAWSKASAADGVVSARSAASVPRQILLPPPGPPQLSELQLDAPGSTPKLMLVSWSIEAPVAPTSIGPHRLSVSVRSHPPSGPAETLVDVTAPLHSLPFVGVGEQLPGPDSRVFRAATGIDKPERWCLWSERPVPEAVTRITVRVIDPLGRVSEASATLAQPQLSNLKAQQLKSITWATWQSVNPVTPQFSVRGEAKPAGRSVALRKISLDAVATVADAADIPAPSLSQMTAMVYRIDDPPQPPTYRAWFKAITPLTVTIEQFGPGSTSTQTTAKLP
jgi:hypothetical protein